MKVNVKKQRRFDRSTVILKLKSEKFLNALKYIQTIISKLKCKRFHTIVRVLHANTVVNYHPCKILQGNPSRCNLCLMEKLCILSADKSTLLNKRSELITKCWHENKFYAANQKRDRFTHPPWVSLNFIPTAVYGTVWWSLRAWNSSNCVVWISTNDSKNANAQKKMAGWIIKKR